MATGINEKVYHRLKEAARARELVYYSEIVRLANPMHLDEGQLSGELGHILGAISEREHDNGHPMLSVVAISSQINMPSKGFFDLARALGRFKGTDPMAELEFFTAELNAAYDFWEKQPEDAPPSKPASSKVKSVKKVPTPKAVPPPEPANDVELFRVYRGAGSLDTTSNAELELLQSFDELPDPWVVIHSAKWLAHETRLGTEGEADFIVAHPSHGVLVIEVKGGKIAVERNLWTSTATNGKVYEIKDPAQQADRSRYNLKTWLEKDDRTRRFSYPVFTAVAFPDVGVSGDMRPDLPQELIIDMTRASSLERTLEEIFSYWKNKYPHDKISGRAAVEALIELLVPTMTLERRVSDIFERERRKIEQLTQEQFHLLRHLQYFRQLAIVGGAGTGKTMLAMEKAQQLSTAGFRVLFVCFNANLARWLEKNLANENIHVSTFHSLVNQARQWADLSPLGYTELIEEAADALVTAAGIIRAPGSGAEDKLFDAIIVDEGQDFADDWWLALPDLLKDPQNGIFYVFFDDNQNVYQQIANLPIKNPPVPLTKNCRNTQEIHKVVSRYTPNQETECIGPQGRPVEMNAAKDHKEAQEALRKALHRLVNQEGISSEDIIILTPRSERTSHWKSDTQIGKFILTRDMDTTMTDAIRLCTIYSFKGLESPVVILSELERANPDVNDALMYVALSRARNQVLVIGELPDPT